MRKFSFLYATGRSLLNSLLSMLNLILAILYMCLPLWLFMLVMQLRDKNNKATAIGTFVKDNSEFQFIYPGYILVSVEPTSLKKWYNNFMRQLYTFLYTNRWLLTVGLLTVITTFVVVNFFM